MEIHKLNYYNFTDVFYSIMPIPTLIVLIRSWAVILIPVMLRVKLDVNWCRDNL